MSRNLCREDSSSGRYKFQHCGYGIIFTNNGIIGFWNKKLFDDHLFVSIVSGVSFTFIGVIILIWSGVLSILYSLSYLYAIVASATVTSISILIGLYLTDLYACKTVDRIPASKEYQRDFEIPYAYIKEITLRKPKFTSKGYIEITTNDTTIKIAILHTREFRLLTRIINEVRQKHDIKISIIK